MARRDQGPPLPQVQHAARNPAIVAWEAGRAFVRHVFIVTSLLCQVSAETHKLWAQELAEKVQRRVDRTSKRTEWASRLEAAAMAAPVVRHTYQVVCAALSNIPARLSLNVAQGM